MTSAFVHHRTSRRATQNGYTLVELLVVLAIVASLAGLLLVGVHSVRRRAEALRCAANLHQIGVAIGLYVSDCQTLPLVYYVNAGVGPPPKRPPSPPLDHDLEMALGSYVSNHDLFRCPIRRRLFPNYDLIYPFNKYPFNETASGLNLSQIRAPESRALTVSDAPSAREAVAHGGKQNALFLDGHVKAYPWIEVFSPYIRDPTWPPD